MDGTDTDTDTDTAGGPGPGLPGARNRRCNGSGMLHVKMRLVPGKRSGISLVFLNETKGPSRPTTHMHPMTSRQHKASSKPSRTMRSANSSRTVRIVEVGPRDGLQNVKEIIPTSTKVDFIRKLCATGLQNIEVTSMVSPRAVPQLADGKAVLEDTQVQQLLQIHPQTRAPVLIPNIKGLDIAMQYGVKEVAVFVSASEGFSQANIKCSVQQGLDNSRKVAERALSHGISVRG